MLQSLKCSCVVYSYIIAVKNPQLRGLVPLIELSYRSVPPVSTTVTISSRTARISFPVAALSRRNSAKVCDMIIGGCQFTVVVFYRP